MLVIGVVSRFGFGFFPPELALAEEAILFGFYFAYFFSLPKSIIPV